MPLTKTSTPCTFEDPSNHISQDTKYHPGTLSILYPSNKPQASESGVSITYTRMEFLSNAVHRVIISSDISQLQNIQSSKKNPKLRLTLSPTTARNNNDAAVSTQKPPPPSSQQKPQAYIFKFVSKKDRDSVQKLLTNRWNIAKGASKAPHTDKEDADKAKKAAVLRESPHLAQSYQELVVRKKLMSTKEFFEQPDVKEQVLKYQQKELPLGPLNDVIAEVKRRLSRLEPGESVYLPPHLTSNILKVYPTIKLAYEMWVPHKFDEDKFWSMFCQSALVHYENPDVVRDDQFISSHRESADEVRKQMEDKHPLNNQVNLIRDENVFEEAFSMMEDNEPRKEINELDTLHDINLTSNCIIKSTLNKEGLKSAEKVASSADTVQLPFVHAMYGNGDSNMEQDEEDLKIEDKRAYFELNKNNTGNGTAVMSEERRQQEEALWAHLKSIAERMESRRVIVDENQEEWEVIFDVDMNEKVFSDLTRKSQSSSRLHNFDHQIDEQSIQRIKQQFKTINQILRPLWTHIQQPRAVIGVRKTKVQLIIQELKKREQQLKNEKKSQSSMGSIINPILETIDVALERADEAGFLREGSSGPTQPVAGAGGSGKAAAGGKKVAAAPVKKKKPAFSKMSFGKK